MTLTAEERTQLRGIVQIGQEQAFRRRRLQIFLQVDAGALGPRPRGCGDSRVVATAPAHGRAGAPGFRTARVGGELRASPVGSCAPGTQTGWVGEAELTKLAKLACSPPSPGAAQWTLQMLADRMVELPVVDSIGRETVRVALQKIDCSLGKYVVGA